MPRKVTITSEPSGADVYQKRPLRQRSQYLGKTPLENITVMVLNAARFRNMSLSDAQEVMSHGDNFVFEVRKEGSNHSLAQLERRKAKPWSTM